MFKLKKGLNLSDIHNIAIHLNMELIRYVMGDAKNELERLKENALKAIESEDINLATELTLKAFQYKVDIDLLMKTGAKFASYTVDEFYNNFDSFIAIFYKYLPKEAERILKDYLDKDNFIN